MVSKSDGVIVRWFGRLAGFSGVWAGDLSATALLTARCLGRAHGLGNDPPGSRAWVGSVAWWYAARAPALMAWAQRGASQKEKTTKSYSPERCG